MVGVVGATVSAVLAALAATFVAVVDASPAAADVAYEGSAHAHGVGLVVVNESLPLGVSPQMQGPTAQARQTSLQQSDTYAAFPDPGLAVTGLLGVAGGAAGVGLPPYPFAVSTAFGDGVEQMSYPGVELRAESGELITEAVATGGSPSSGITSTARVVNDAGTITATAASDADALRLGDSLILSGLHAAAAAARDTTGELTRSSTLTFTSLSAPNLTVTLPAPPGTAGPASQVAVPSIGLTDGGFTAAMHGSESAAVPIPVRDALAAFAQAGYQATYQDAHETADGIVGAGFQLTSALPAPPGGSVGGLSGQTPFTLTFGLAEAAISF